MNLSPDTEILLLNVPIEIDYKNQLTFNSSKDQENYFKKHVVYRYDEVSYQRKDDYIRIDKNYDELYNVNYVMYKNNTLPNKWIYAFVINKTYENENCTYLFIETDVFQTWQFYIDYKESFVEREMINTENDIPRL